MELDIIQTKTTWNDAAGSINNNYAKIADAIAQLKANGGGGVSYDRLDSWADYTSDKAGYVLSALLGYDLNTRLSSVEGDYATKDYVNNKLVDYAPLTSVQGFENRIGGLEGAVLQLNERVSTVEDKVSSLNETVSTGENNLLGRVNVIEQEYATKTYVDNAIDGIDLSPYLLKADLTKSRIQSTLGISDWALAVTKPSYAWSEITSRPTALSQFTDDLVAGKYLPLSGGTINSTAVQPLYLKNKQSNCGILFFNNTDSATLMYSGGSNWRVTDNGWSNAYYLLHSGNIGNYKAGDSAKLGGYDISRFLLTTKRDYTTMDLNTIGDKQSIFTEIRTGEVTTLNCPISGYGALLSLKDGNSHAKMQIVSASCSADTYIRCVQGVGSTISANWRRIITDKNIGNCNAGSANILQALSDKYYVTANKRDDNWEVALKIGGWESEDAGFATRYGTVVDIAGFNTWYHRLAFNTNGTIEHWMGINTFEMSRVGDLAYLTSNVASATKLANKVSLWGNEFNGTADVSGNLYSDIWRVIKDSTWNGTFIQSANYDGTSDSGNIYMSARNGNKLTSFNVWATNSIFSDNIISPRFETTALSTYSPKRKAALDGGGLIVYGADNSGWASGIFAENPDDNTNIGAIAAAFGSSSYTPQFYYYGGAYNDPFLKIYQTDRRIISSGLFLNIGKEISPYASNRTEIALINPNAEPSMLRLGSNGDVKWGVETSGSTDNYAFSIYSWTAATHCLRILNNGNVGIGNTSPAERLDVSGNIKASGNINATSITINGVTITASNGSITVNGNVLATGDITGGV